MKRLLVVTMILGLVFGSLAAADAKKKKKPGGPVRMEEVIEVPYEGSHLGASTPVRTGGVCLVDQSLPFHCLSATPTIKDARYVRIEVSDATGQKVGGFISQGDVDGDGLNDGFGGFCGAHAEPVEMNTPSEPIAISLYMGICSDASGPSIATTGTITVTFSNLP